MCSLCPSCSKCSTTHEKVGVKWLEFISDFENFGLMEEDPEDSERFLISIYKQRRWDSSSKMLILGTLLHELAHAAMDILGFHCQKCLCFLIHLGAHGLSGHDPSWMKLARALELEANRVFPLKTRIWDLDVQDDGVSADMEEVMVDTYTETILTAFEADLM